VKRTDVEGARYAEVECVDSSLTVSKLIARWVSDKKLDVEPSLVTLRLVTCAPGDDPSQAQEQAATTALSPRRMLREAGVVDGSSLLADFANEGPGPAAGVSFESLLGISGAYRQPVIMRAYLRFSYRINAVVLSRNAPAAREIYLDTERLPSLITAECLSEQELQLDGSLFEGSVLTVCFRGLDVLLLKSLDEREAARARILQDASRDVTRSAHVVRFELAEAHGKRFMLMPKLEATLETIPWLSEPDALVLVQHLTAGLRWLHHLGFAHADVKPANVALRDRAFQLIDLGSVSRFNEPTSCTEAYVPCDLFSTPARVRGSAALDWWMLGMTLGEKCCSRGHCLRMGAPSQRLSKAELSEHLQTHLPPAVWAAFRLLIS
jgi:hypothetical protein